MRRARRLLPALFVVLAAVGVYACSCRTGSRRTTSPSTASRRSFYVANWHFIDSGQSYIQQFLAVAPSPLRHMWSLAIEEQFYLVWPLIVFRWRAWSARRAASARGAAATVPPRSLRVCVVLGIASFVRMVDAVQSGERRRPRVLRHRHAGVHRAHRRGARRAQRGRPHGAGASRRGCRSSWSARGCAIALVVRGRPRSRPSRPGSTKAGTGSSALLMVRRARSARRSPGVNPMARCSRRARSSVSGSSRTACTCGTGRSHCGSPPTTPVSTASRCSPSAPWSRSRRRWPATTSSRCRSGAVTGRASRTSPSNRAVVPIAIVGRAGGVAGVPGARVPVGRRPARGRERAPGREPGGHRGIRRRAALRRRTRAHAAQAQPRSSRCS